MKLSVILPCFNEEENVSRIASELLPVLESMNCDYEVVIIDDGSRDGTVEKAKHIENTRMRIFEHGRNKGLGVAVRTGIDNAKGDIIITMDSDFTFHPLLIKDLITAHLAHPEVDFIIGSANLGGYGKGIPAWRLYISKLSNTVYRLMLGRSVTSVNQIFRLYKTEQIKKLRLTSVGFEINAEILFKLVFSGRKFIEVPAELTQRKFGVSKLNYLREIRRHVALIGKIFKWKLFGF